LAKNKRLELITSDKEQGEAAEDEGVKVRYPLTPHLIRYQIEKYLLEKLFIA